MIKKGKSKKKIIITILIIAAIILLVFALKLYLSANLLLGNDLVIKLNSDKENLFLNNGESENISFDSRILTNPFCTANCSFKFEDLSENDIIEEGYFKLKPIVTESKEYIIYANKSGSGQKIYRFSMQCRSAKTFLCQTNEIPRTKSILITLNYDLSSEEQEFRQDSKEKINSSIQKINYLDAGLKNTGSIIENLNKTIDTDSYIEENSKIYNGILLANKTDYRLKELWESGDYEFSEELDTAKQAISDLEERFRKMNDTLSSDVSSYNGLIEELANIGQNLTSMKQMNLSNNSVADVNGAIRDFNDALNNFSQRNSIESKKSSIKKISKEIEKVWNTISSDTRTPCCFANETPGAISISKINISVFIQDEVNISFKEPASECCLFGKCEECCNESCKSDEKTYPVILLHGHDFNKKASAEYSLYDFQEIQAALENDSYLNAGTIIIDSEDNRTGGIWGRINIPVTVIASYYFDIYKNKEENKVIETKTDSIDTYAIRLKDIVDIVKYKTGKDKVIIVTHSMGGVVARRYIQIFGADDVDKMILIASPNKGIDGNILSICSLFGAGLECRDLDKNGLFMNKLNYDSSAKVPTYNIIGTGCSMTGETGDGIVKNSSAYLEGAENYYVKGSCEELKFSYLHNTLIEDAKYPEVYGLILSSLKKW